jgi:hypothetical protein
MLEAVFSVGSAPRLYSEDPRPAERFGSSVQFYKVRLGRDGAIVELTFDKRSVAGYSPNSNDVRA